MPAYPDMLHKNYHGVDYCRENSSEGHLPDLLYTTLEEQARIFSIFKLALNMY